MNDNTAQDITEDTLTTTAVVDESAPEGDAALDVAAVIKKDDASTKRQGKGGRSGGRRSGGEHREREPKEFEEKTLAIDRVTRVVKGGRRMRFRALVVVGDKKGRVGYATAKSNEVSAAVQKAIAAAKKRLITVNIVGGTVLHDVMGNARGSQVLLKKARKDRGLIAGASVRAVLELAGYRDIVAKSFGSNNKMNTVLATLDALQSLLPYKKKEQVSPKGAPSGQKKQINKKTIT